MDNFCRRKRRMVKSEHESDAEEETPREIIPKSQNQNTYMKWYRAQISVRKKVNKLNKLVSTRRYCFIEIDFKTKKVRYEGDPIVATSLSAEVCEEVVPWVKRYGAKDNIRFNMEMEFPDTETSSEGFLDTSPKVLCTRNVKQKKSQAQMTKLQNSNVIVFESESNGEAESSDSEEETESSEAESSHETPNYRKLENMDETEMPTALTEKWTVVTPNMSRSTIVRASDEQVKEEDKEGGRDYISKTSDCEDQVTGDSLVQVPIDPSCDTEMKPFVASTMANLSEDVSSLIEGNSSIDYINLKQENSSEVLEDVPSKLENFSSVIQDVCSNVGDSPSIAHIKEENCLGIIEDVHSIIKGESSIGHGERENLLELNTDIPCDTELTLDHFKKWSEEQDVTETKLWTFPSIDHVKEENLLGAHVSAPCEMEVAPGVDQNLLEASANNSAIEVKPAEEQMMEDSMDVENKDEGVQEEDAQLRTQHSREGKPSRCPICGAEIRKSYSLKQHMRTQHTGEQPYSCEACTASFTQSRYLRTHMRTHTGEKSHSCGVCSAVFRRMSDLKRHARTHTGEKPYSCDLCTASFSVNYALKIHMMTHTGEKPYRCDVCNAAFTQKCGLKKHMRTHTGEKPYSCDLCSATFRDGSNLKGHMRTHTGEKPYSCGVCSASFTLSGSLKKHMRTHTVLLEKGPTVVM